METQKELRDFINKTLMQKKRRIYNLIQNWQGGTVYHDDMEPFLQN